MIGVKATLSKFAFYCWGGKGGSTLVLSLTHIDIID